MLIIFLNFTRVYWRIQTQLTEGGRNFFIWARKSSLAVPPDDSTSAEANNGWTPIDSGFSDLTRRTLSIEAPGRDLRYCLYLNID